MLNFRLTGRVEVVGIGGPGVDVLDDWEDVDDVLLVEQKLILQIKWVFTQLQLKR